MRIVIHTIIKVLAILCTVGTYNHIKVNLMDSYTHGIAKSFVNANLHQYNYKNTIILTYKCGS